MRSPHIQSGPEKNAQNPMHRHFATVCIAVESRGFAKMLRMITRRTGKF